MKIHNMKHSLLTLSLLLSAVSTPVSAQNRFSVLSYNVENLFDTEDDPHVSDEEFLPEGERHWTEGRYYHKLQQISRVITAAGEWDTPALVGLCEVEDEDVMTDLLAKTPLKNQHYRFQITHGRDTRGINVALLYQRDKFAYVGHKEHSIYFSREKNKRTRNLLHVWGKIPTGDLLDVFVCHLPSRANGEKETEDERAEVAHKLRHLCDSLHRARPLSRIIIMGDFNDTPADASLRNVLRAAPLPAIVPPVSPKSPLQLYNLFAGNKKRSPGGTHKFRGRWNQLDHIIISSSLAANNASMRLRPGSIRNFAPSFILEDEKNGRGKRPRRTYNGFKHEGGFSDHLPVMAEFVLTKP